MVKRALKLTKGGNAAAKQAAGTGKPSTQTPKKGKQPEKQPSKAAKPSAAPNKVTAKKATLAKKPSAAKVKKNPVVVDHEDDGGDEDENADNEDQPEDEDEEEEDGDEGDERDEPLSLKRFRRLDASASLDIRKKRGTEKIYQLIRVLVRHITEYSNPITVLTDALALSTMDVSDMPSAVAEGFDDDVFSEMLWPEFVKWLPELEEHLEAFSEDPDLIAHVGSYISGVSKKTRSDDLPRVKAEIIKLAGIIDKEHVFDDKTNRGFNNTATARYLCPASEIDDFEDDPVLYCRLARKGKKLILSDDWPMLCYNERLRDVRDPKAGLFRSKLAIKVYQLVFTGRGSALDEFYKATGNMKGKLPVSKRAKLEKVTIGNIAYVHLLMRFAFNAQPTWQDSDGKNWHAEGFTRSIFNAAFQSPKWAAELEAWWTSQVFGSGGEDPPELKQKRKATMFALFTQTSERSLQRRGASPQEWIGIPVKDNHADAVNGEDEDNNEGENNEGENNEGDANNVGHTANENGRNGNDGANNKSAGEESDRDGTPSVDGGGTANKAASDDRTASGRKKRKITEWQPDLSAIKAGPPTKRIKPTPKNRSQAQSATDGLDVPTDGGAGHPETTAREGSDMEDMYAE